jgi:hypothetical protein
MKMMSLFGNKGASKAFGLSSRFIYCKMKTLKYTEENELRSMAYVGRRYVGEEMLQLPCHTHRSGKQSQSKNNMKN